MSAHPAPFSVGFDRRTTLATLDARVLDARPTAALYHPYIHEAGERGPFVDVNARAQFTGLSMRTSFLDELNHEGSNGAGLLFNTASGCLLRAMAGTTK